jgi:hypothetical protein
MVSVVTRPIMLSVIMLNVVMLSVVASFQQHQNIFKRLLTEINEFKVLQ